MVTVWKTLAPNNDWSSAQNSLTQSERFRKIGFCAPSALVWKTPSQGSAKNTKATKG